MSIYCQKSVSLDNISKSYGHRAVLEGISLELSGGESLCICGANAVGKTTLLKVMAGLLQPDKGKVGICGFDLKKQAQLIKPLIGVVLHESMLYSELTVFENLRFFADLYGVRDSKNRIAELIEMMGLGYYRYDNAGTISRGILRRLAIARALIHRPMILLADEPFSGLDSQASDYLSTILNKFTDDNGIVVMTSHNMNLSLKNCSRIAVLDNKQIIYNQLVSKIDTAEFSRDYLSYARGHN